MASTRRTPRNLTSDEVYILTNLTPDDVDKQLMMKYFANFENKDAKFIPQDRFTLSKDIINKYAETDIAQVDVPTTIGRYLFNLFIIFPYPKLLIKEGYINETCKKGKTLGIMNDMANLLLEDQIKTEDYFDFNNRINWFGFANSAFINPSVNYDIVKPLPKVMSKKKELLEKNKEGIENIDINTTSAIEEELIDLAKKELTGNPAKDLYDSGAKVNWGNQYKSMNIMSGPIRDNDNGGYRLITKSFVEGIDAEDIAANGDSLVSGVYGRAVGTQKGGYEGKKLMASFQSIKLGPKDSDCHSNKYFKVYLTKDNAKFYKYRYIKVGSNLVCLTPEELSKHYDSYIYLRSPLYCKDKCFCNKCAGEAYYKLGIENIGLTMNKISSISLNSSLKQFHDQSIHVTTFDWEDYIY